jgi:hypothetical protein
MPLLLFVASLVACGGGTAPSTTRPTTTARLQIVAPKANEETGPDVTLQFVLTGAKIAPRTGGKPSPDEGVIHINLDGEVALVYSTVEDLVDLEPGEHTVKAEFVAADHAPFKNRVLASVRFRVR